MKRVLFNLHLWIGLSVGLLVVVLGLSGSALVFRGDIERLQTREWRTVVPTAAKVPLDGLVLAALVAVPGKVLARISLPAAPTDSVVVFVQKPRPRTLKDAELVAVFLDPYRGTVLGTRQTNGGWIWKLQDLHYALLSGEVGLKINGVAAVALAALSFSGPILWWPGWRRRRSAFRVRMRPALAKWRDLHAITGLLASTALLLIALTGAYYAYRSTATAVVTLASGNAAILPPALVSRQNSPPVPLSVLLAFAQAAVPNATLDELKPARGGAGPVSISFRVNGDVVVGRNRLFLDPVSGRVLRIDWFEKQNVAARILGNMAPWHYGNFGGRLTQWLWLVTGLVPAFLFGSGLWLWWRRSRRAGDRSAEHSAHSLTTSESMT